MPNDPSNTFYACVLAVVADRGMGAQCNFPPPPPPHTDIRFIAALGITSEVWKVPVCLVCGPKLVWVDSPGSLLHLVFCQTFDYAVRALLHNRTSGPSRLPLKNPTKAGVTLSTHASHFLFPPPCCSLSLLSSPSQSPFLPTPLHV